MQVIVMVMKGPNLGGGTIRAKLLNALGQITMFKAMHLKIFTLSTHTLRHGLRRVRNKQWTFKTTDTACQQRKVQSRHPARASDI